MKTLIQSRLKELETEYQKGQERLSALEQEVSTVRHSMLRISGAIQVLQELLSQTATLSDIEHLATIENGTV